MQLILIRLHVYPFSNDTQHDHDQHSRVNGAQHGNCHFGERI